MTPTPIVRSLTLSSALLLALAAGCGRGRDDRADRGTDSVPGEQLVATGDTSRIAERPLEVVEGDATYYGTLLDGERTASGERLDADEELVGAHPGWPFGSMARVTAKETGRQVTVRIIDRGPAQQHLKEGVVIDLSVAAARALRMRKDGQIPVRVEVLRWGTNRKVAPEGTAR